MKLPLNLIRNSFAFSQIFQAITLIDEQNDILLSIPSLEQVEKMNAATSLVLYVYSDDECREASKIACPIQDVKEVHVRKRKRGRNRNSKGR